MDRTEFLPAALADAETVRRQRAAVMGVPKLVEVLDAVHDLVVVLNRERQIVYANKAAVEFIRAHGGAPEAGVRWGEALLCEHACAGGCGTTSFCRDCGAARAVWSSQLGRDESAECRITQADGDALDFRVKTARMTVDEDEFTIFTAVDTGDEKRREALQRTFFHDVLNTAFGVRGIVELFPEANAESQKTFIQLLDGLSDELIEEIAAQRDLLAAENRSLAIKPGRVDPPALLREVVAAHRRQNFAKGKFISLEPVPAGVELNTDRTLLRRVLANMIKNALEAALPGETVSVGCELKDGAVEFRVHNPEVMSEMVRHQVFRRSFSTKGAGRGLGTYSMKLLTERYLGGTMGFTSAKGEGTSFTARYPLTLASKT